MCGPCELRSNRMSFISNMSSPCCPLLPVVCITPVTRIGGNGQALRNNYTVELVAGATRDISERKNRGATNADPVGTTDTQRGSTKNNAPGMFPGGGARNSSRNQESHQ
jgi:hypothetical protein